VQIIELLKHHFVTQHRLWMRAFLPELMFAFDFMSSAKILKLVSTANRSFRPGDAQ
jgi:hypothetical protein